MGDRTAFRQAANLGICASGRAGSSVNRTLGGRRSTNRRRSRRRWANSLMRTRQACASQASSCADATLSASPPRRITQTFEADARLFEKWFGKIVVGLERKAGFLEHLKEIAVRADLRFGEGGRKGRRQLRDRQADIALDYRRRARLQRFHHLLRQMRGVPAIREIIDAHEAVERGRCEHMRLEIDARTLTRSSSFAGFDSVLQRLERFLAPLEHLRSYRDASPRSRRPAPPGPGLTPPKHLGAETKAIERGAIVGGVSPAARALRPRRRPMQSDAAAARTAVPRTTARRRRRRRLLVVGAPRTRLQQSLRRIPSPSHQARSFARVSANFVCRKSVLSGEAAIAAVSIPAAVNDLLGRWRLAAIFLAELTAARSMGTAHSDRAMKARISP